MRILLLFPGWTGEYGLFSHFARKASTWPPLNLAYLAAIAESEGHKVEIIDGEAERLSVKRIIKQIHQFGPDIIGMTATSPFYHVAVDCARQIKAANGTATLVVGGPHITILKEEAFASCFDYAFIGEAEKPWQEFIQRFEAKEDISDIRGLLYRRDGNVVFTGMPDPIEEIDSLPYPARHLLRLENYRIGTLQGRKNFTTVMTTRGCPFKCVFCSTKVFGCQLRKRDPQAVVDEIRSAVSSFGIKHFIFLDDTLTLDRNHVLRICSLLRKENLSITFEGSTRANLIDDELMAAMAESGLIRISYGLETVDSDIRRLIRKEVPLESYTTANRISNKYEVETLNSVMIGLPGETRETASKTLDYLRNAREIHQANLSIATPYPGTELFQMAKEGKHGLRLLTEDFSQYRRYGSAVMEVNDLSAQDLLDLQNDGFLKIYSAPWRIIPMLRKSGLFGGVLMIVRLFRKLTRHWQRSGGGG